MNAPAKNRRAPMGRLFWKFFFVFWLAQLFTSIGVGVTMWALRPDYGERPPAFDHPPPSLSPPPDFRLMPPPPGAGNPLHRPGGRGHHPWRPPLLPLIAGSLASLIFAALLAWYFSRPIRVLRQAFNAVAGGQLDARVGSAMRGRRDELSDLGAEFDRMADRLQALIESQRRLLHDVSHELRSPLARLQAAVDLMRQQPARASELITRIERDSGRMDTLVGELLTLARLDAGVARTESAAAEVVDLADLLAAIAEDAEFEAGVDPALELDDGAAEPCLIQTDFTSPLPVRGDRELLHRALENVVRNAVRHSRRVGAAPCEVVISARVETMPGDQRDQRVIVVEVADRGPGVPEADLANIFEAFVRGDSKPSSGGYGLGLAITRRVIETHGGTVAAQNRAGGGLILALRLPAA